jgi:hypothetical protein
VNALSRERDLGYDLTADMANIGVSLNDEGN